LALSREGLETEFAPPFAAPPGARRRVALHARKGARDAARLGYKARRSWSLVEIWWRSRSARSPIRSWSRPSPG
jgi:23S rRNA (uracil1939-C5)-methyltransferase